MMSCAEPSLAVARVTNAVKWGLSMFNTSGASVYVEAVLSADPPRFLQLFG